LFDLMSEVTPDFNQAARIYVFFTEPIPASLENAIDQDFSSSSGTQYSSSR